MKNTQIFDIASINNENGQVVINCLDTSVHYGKYIQYMMAKGNDFIKNICFSSSGNDTKSISIQMDIEMISKFLKIINKMNAIENMELVIRNEENTGLEDSDIGRYGPMSVLVANARGEMDLEFDHIQQKGTISYIKDGQKHIESINSENFHEVYYRLSADLNICKLGEGPCYRGKVPEEEQAEIAARWGEGRKSLENLILFCLKNGIMTDAAQAGYYEGGQAYLKFQTADDFTNAIISELQKRTHFPIFHEITNNIIISIIDTTYEFADESFEFVLKHMEQIVSEKFMDYKGSPEEIRKQIGQEYRERMSSLKKLIQYRRKNNIKPIIDYEHDDITVEELMLETQRREQEQETKPINNKNSIGKACLTGKEPIGTEEYEQVSQIIEQERNIENPSQENNER